MLVQGKILSYGSDLSDVFMIRNEVFQEEMGCPPEIENSNQDDMFMHVIVYEEAGSMKAVATGRIAFDGISCVIDQIAVLKEYRNRKYGDFTVRMLLNKAFTSGIHIVECIVPADKVVFFESIGFHIIGDGAVINNQNSYKMFINESDIMTACHKSL